MYKWCRVGLSLEICFSVTRWLINCHAIWLGTGYTLLGSWSLLAGNQLTALDFVWWTVIVEAHGYTSLLKIIIYLFYSPWFSTTTIDNMVWINRIYCIKFNCLITSIVSRCTLKNKYHVGARYMQLRFKSCLNRNLICNSHYNLSFIILHK